MENYITPNDKGVMGKTDSISINNAVKKAKEEGVNRVLIPRVNKRTNKNEWDVDEAIWLTSDIEIILDNCYLRNSDNTFDNIFTNHRNDSANKSIKGEQQNIKITGLGNAVIDGGKPNGLTELTSKKDGMPHVSKNNPILLYNVRNLVIKGITIKNQRWWGINLIYCEKVRISDIIIDAKNNIHNQDGIDIRIGCSDVIIENIFGQSGDDLIALTAIGKGREKEEYEIEGKSMDIHDVIIKNVIGTSADCAIIGLRNNDGVKIYNISVDNIHYSLNGIENKDPENANLFYDHKDGYKKIYGKSPYVTVRVGDTGYFKERPCILGEMYNISVTNVFARCNKAIIINGSLKNSYFSNIRGSENVTHLISTTPEYEGPIPGADMENVVFENLYFDGKSDSKLFDFKAGDSKKTFKNVIARNVFAGKCKNILNMEHEGEFIIENLFSDNIKDAVIKKGNGKVTVK